ncbi:hypothetical protein [Pantoea stewartii]|nr:hypothetical protein [Pantoea stewartii]
MIFSAGTPRNDRSFLSLSLFMVDAILVYADFVTPPITPQSAA